MKKGFLFLLSTFALVASVDADQTFQFRPEDNLFDQDAQEDFPSDYFFAKCVVAPFSICSDHIVPTNEKSVITNTDECVHIQKDIWQRFPTNVTYDAFCQVSTNINGKISSFSLFSLPPNNIVSFDFINIPVLTTNEMEPTIQVFWGIPTISDFLEQFHFINCQNGNQWDYTITPNDFRYAATVFARISSEFHFSVDEVSKVCLFQFVFGENRKKSIDRFLCTSSLSILPIERGNSTMSFSSMTPFSNITTQRRRNRFSIGLTSIFFDFGERTEIERPVLTATLRNDGDRTVHVTDVVRTCVCANLELSATNLPPGGEAEVRCTLETVDGAQVGEH